MTIAGGCLFGTVGLVLAAPLVSAAVRIVADIGAAEREAWGRADERGAAGDRLAQLGGSRALAVVAAGPPRR